MRLALKCLVPAVLGIGAAVMEAGAADPSDARNLSAACFTCHGTNGHSVGGNPPSLAGQNQNYLLQQLKDFKAGKRPATIMHQQAKGYSDEELEMITGYFAGVKAVPGPSGAPASRY